MNKVMKLCPFIDGILKFNVNGAIGGKLGPIGIGVMLCNAAFWLFLTKSFGVRVPMKHKF